MFFWHRRHPVGDRELSAYLDGQLSPASRVRLEEHLEACAAFQAILQKTDDHAEALAAFFEKRSAQFQGK